MKITEMENIVETAVKVLVGTVTADMKADDALKITQAALNLEHILAVKDDMPLKTTF